MQLAAIGSIDNRTLGDGGMGPVTRQLHTLYFDTVRLPPRVRRLAHTGI
ncbi:MAG: hypothetical protein R2838_23660 [Caldilineaceae bacterium]